MGRHCQRRRYMSGDASGRDDATPAGWAGKEGEEWRRLFTYLTRLLFVAVVLSTAVVIAASLLLLSRCRRAVKPMEGLVDGSRGLCSTLGLPAYFACLVLAVTVFGLGCVGRRVSGLLLIGVSAAAAVVAVILVMTHTCPTDGAGSGSGSGSRSEADDEDKVEAVLASLAGKLELCGLYPASSPPNASQRTAGGSSQGGGWLYPVQFQRFDVLAESSALAACRDTVSGFNRLCGQHLPARLLVLSRHQQQQQQQRSAVAVGGGGDGGGQAPPVVNGTGLRLCASHVTDTLRELCTRDSEVGFPILVTAPIFFLVVGVGLVYVQQAEERRGRSRGEKAGGGSGCCCSAVMTTTTTAATAGGSDNNAETRRLSSSPPSSPSRGRRALGACLRALCTGHSLCFTCLLRGHRCPPSSSCCPSPSLSTTTALTVTHALPSKVSFRLTELREPDGARRSGHRLLANGRARTRSFSDSEEELHLIHDFV